MVKKEILILGAVAIVAIAVVLQLKPNAKPGTTTPQANATASQPETAEDIEESNRQSCIKSIAYGGKKPEEFCTCKMNLSLNVMKLKNDHMRGFFGEAFFNKLMNARATNPSQEEMKRWFEEEGKFDPTVTAYKTAENEKCLAFYVPDEEGAVNQLYGTIYSNCMTPGDPSFMLLQPAAGNSGQHSEKFCQCTSKAMAKSQYLTAISSIDPKKDIFAAFQQSIADLAECKN